MNQLKFIQLQMALEQATLDVLPPSELYEDLDPEKDEIDVEDMNVIEQNEQYINGEEKKIEDIVGVPKSALPSVEELSDYQVEILVEKMISLWNAFHFTPDFPDAIPVRLKYTLMEDKWDYETTYVTCGMIHIEFCDFNPEYCPFSSSFCECKELVKEFERKDDCTDDFNSREFLKECWDKNRIRKIFVLNHTRDNYIYQCFVFDNHVKEFFYPGDNFLSPGSTLSMEEKIELTRDLAGKKDAFMPGLVKEIELIFGKENSIYDYWEFSDSDFALYWWIHKSVYQEKMKLLKDWAKYKEIESLIEFSIVDSPIPA